MRKGGRERKKGSHCFCKSSGYDKLELKHKIGFFKLIECIIQKRCRSVKQNAKICAIGEQNVIN